MNLNIDDLLIIRRALKTQIGEIRCSIDRAYINNEHERVRKLKMTETDCLQALAKIENKIKSLK